MAGDGITRSPTNEVAVKGLHRIEVRDSNGDPYTGKQKRYPALTPTVIHAEERGTPKNRKKIDWKLITDLLVPAPTPLEKLEWYGLKWKIEVFHKILKSDCKADESKLRTAQRLTNLISLFCILSWRLRIPMIARGYSNLMPRSVPI
ncbi:hypothetical protein EAS62_39605 [Bradyrhizobium zhanjiangense]|uniref:Transposase IS4-like domain-containing protein n=1 Tax=Bradyrhizobium zhanjiangense TaxID=1325107 RepID=A0ABY0D9U8_9BRAD|nr:hypothetical protein EAS62_39605 [Bradyrhizobium zhanjiangense]